MITYQLKHKKTSNVYLFYIIMDLYLLCNRNVTKNGILLFIKLLEQNDEQSYTGLGTTTEIQDLMNHNDNNTAATDSVKIITLQYSFKYATIIKKILQLSVKMSISEN